MREAIFAVSVILSFLSGLIVSPYIGNTFDGQPTGRGIKCLNDSYVCVGVAVRDVGRMDIENKIGGAKDILCIGEKSVEYKSIIRNSIDGCGSENYILYFKKLNTNTAIEVRNGTITRISRYGSKVIDF